MSAPAEAEPRNVVPTWRATSRSSQIGDLNPLVIRRTDVSATELDEPASAFARSPGLHTALDFLTVASVLGIEDSQLESARQVAGYRLTTGALESVSSAQSTTSEARASRSAIRSFRARLAADPRDALTWVDMSLVYTNLGQRQPAIRAMEIALKLQPRHRYVLRCASRLFVHNGDPKRAVTLLRASGQSNLDPWVAAAHMAAAEINGNGAPNSRTAREMLVDGSFAPASVAELASQLGTLELRHGRVRQGRAFINQSLTQPNGNVLAQAASIVSLGVEAPSDSLVDTTPLSDEAQARMGAFNLEWPQVMGATQRWHADQPFSTLAAIFAGWAAGIMGEGYSEARDLIDLALRANHDDEMLLNNSAFIAIHLGDLSAAANQINRAIPLSSGFQISILQATAGLLAYRSGDVTIGRDLYQRAVESLRTDSNPYSYEMATLYWAFEESTHELGPAESARIAETLRRNLKSPLPELRFLAERLEKGAPAAIPRPR
ncbi:MAG: tetratricopeptide repeat protein [Glaciihabitans sp.]|nr:tetratricopeptide repeat protein [Glaciihabitans sp.]